jgi:hypothetical protein
MVLTLENFEMKIGKFARLLVLVAPLALTLAACSDDPTSEGVGDAFAIVTNKSATTAAVGDKFTVVAQVIDRAGTPLPIQVTVTAGNAAAVTNDSTRFVPELQETRIYARAVKAVASAPLILTAGALSDTVKVTVQ